MINYCADSKLDCAVNIKRPFIELYTGLGAIFGIIIGVTFLIYLVNFCLIYKFCQRYDENLDALVGGVSICDMISCVLTLGLIYRKNEDDGTHSADELDFRKRFEKSMEKQHGEMAIGEVKKKRPHERRVKDVYNYLSAKARLR